MYFFYFYEINANKNIDSLLIIYGIGFTVLCSFYEEMSLIFYYLFFV